VIIGKHYGIHSVDRLLARLAKSRLAVVRLSAGDVKARAELCTGFFITPTLIVAPAFAFRKEFKSVFAECFRDGRQIWRQTIRGPFELLKAAPEAIPAAWTGDETLLAVLHVASEPARPLPSRGFVSDEDDSDGVLELGFDAPEPGQFVAVVQFPRGGTSEGVSFGTLKAAEGDVLDYDADTDIGSSGGPVVDANWRVIGMHLVGSAGSSTNRAISRAVIVGALRQSRHWAKIRKRHRIADVAAAAEKISRDMAPVEREKPNAFLTAAALTAWLDRDALNEAQQAQLQPYVVDAKSDKWVMRSSERARILGRAGSLGELKKADKLRGAPRSDVTQIVIDRIVDGPPYDLSSFSEEALATWIQAARWFAGVHRAIPTPAAVTRVLDRRRTRSRLDAIVGSDFQGRRQELDFLQYWWRRSKNPLSITGIGGVGKSALVAQFALTKLPPRTLLLWLDFDRADVAPDDAPSVLAALTQQASVQLDRFQAPDTNPDEWEAYATALGTRLQEALPRRAMALLVLDSFEAAQYTAKYQELWPVLERVAETFPHLRLIVTGRAEVPNLEFRGLGADQRYVTGMEKSDARKWLREHGVTKAAVLNKVIDLAVGIPLILRLALQLIERGGAVDDLPQQLPSEIVIGYLYERILNRVQNPELKPVARGALVLRRLTEEMVQPVLEGLVEMPAREIAAWFPELSREMSLVQGTGVLRLRPEVRRGALTMLERDDAALVRSVDERAADWYASQNTSDPEIAAELVYHRLRLGDVRGAEQAWRDGCGRFLIDATDELPQKPRKWLEARLGVALPIAAEDQLGVETEAAERIRSARSRGHARAVGGILEEREKFTDNSPLVFQAAYERWVAGDVTEALGLLSTSGEATGPVARDRTVFRALLAAKNDPVGADRLLSTVDDEEQWADRDTPALYRLAVRAARIRLTVDLDNECTVIANPGLLPTAFRALSPLDVLLPRLTSIVRGEQLLVESASPERWVDVGNEAEFTSALEEVRVEDSEPALLLVDRLRKQQEWRTHGVWYASHHWSAGTVPPPIATLLEKSWWRWTLLSMSPFLYDAARPGVMSRIYLLGGAVMGTVALLAFPRKAASGTVLHFSDPNLGPLNGRFSCIFCRRIRSNNSFTSWRGERRSRKGSWRECSIRIRTHGTSLRRASCTSCCASSIRRRKAPSSSPGSRASRNTTSTPISSHTWSGETFSILAPCRERTATW